VLEFRILHPPPAPVAQWIARPPPKGQVAGSIPARGTIQSLLIINQHYKFLDETKNAILDFNDHLI
jgi:hypothetical protein